MMFESRLVSIAVLVSVTLWVPSSARGSDGVLEVDFCTVASSPEDYVGQVVKVGGVVTFGFEKSIFTATECRDEWWLDRPGAREAYLDLLGEAADTSDVQVLAYCLIRPDRTGRRRPPPACPAGSGRLACGRRHRSSPYPRAGCVGWAPLPSWLQITLDVSR